MLPSTKMMLFSRTVKIVNVRVEAASELEAGMEAVFSESLESRAAEVGGSTATLFAVFLAAKVQASRDHLDVPLPQGIVDHVLIFFHLKNTQDHQVSQRAPPMPYTPRPRNCSCANVHV